MYSLPGALAPLAKYRQFILVQLLPAVDKAGNVIPGKSVKEPFNYKTLTRWSAHDPSIWADCETISRVAAHATVWPNTIGWCVGFVITKADPIACMDLDSCATLAGGWNDEAQEMMRRYPGAYELSLSGQGLHGWATYQGVAPEHGKRNAARNMEFYTELRFIALGGAASGVMGDITHMLPQFIADFFPVKYAEALNDENWTSEPTPEYTPLTDTEILHRAMARSRPQEASAVFGGGAPLPSFSDLWTRNVEVLSRAYPPQMPNKDIDGSAADMALAKELSYWTGKNCERVAQLMEMSALKRDKWLPSVHATYFKDTVMRGVSVCTAVYKAKASPRLAPPPPNRLAPKLIEHNTFVGRENLMVLFAGCVYIQDQNCILLPNGDIVDQARFNAKFAGYTFCLDNNNDKLTKSAWEAFLGNQIIAFPRVEGTTFDPAMEFQSVVERAGRTWVNVYKAPLIDRQPGDCTPFMELLKKLLPREDDALILLSYMAAIVQYPGVKFRWAPFIQGTRGNGKSTIVECLKHALGHKYIFTLKAGMIENGFNAWLENNLLYVADDIYSSKDRADMMEALKSLITGRDQSITLKGIDSIQKRIVGNFMFTDNHKDSMKKQDDTRDICTLYCAQQSKRDRIRDGLTNDFFVRTFIPWLNTGGFAYVADMLATMPIDARYNPASECQEAPDTSVTREAVSDGRTGLEHEVAEWIELEEPGFCGGFVSYHMLKAKLETIPRYAKFVSPLKIKEMMLRLGFEPHRKLIDGRLPSRVYPDNTRPILYVQCDSWQAELEDPAIISTLYVDAQEAAQTASVAYVFNR